MPRRASAPLRRHRYSSVLESALVGLGREDAVVLSTRKPRKKWRLDAYESPIRGLRKTLSAPVGVSIHRNTGTKISNGDEDDPFAHLKLLVTHKEKKKKRRNRQERETVAVASPAVTRSVTKQKKERRRTRCCAGVLELAGRTTPVTRFISKRKKRSSLETIEDLGVSEEENEEEEEEEVDVVVQKKLFQSPEVKKKKKMMKKRVEANDKTVGYDAGQEEGHRVMRKAVVLEQWYVEWPPVLEKQGRGNAERALLVLSGRVNGKFVQLTVEKRKETTKFTSIDGKYVVLSGNMDRDAAKSAGMPVAAMELMNEGIPAYFYKHLLPFVQSSPVPVTEEEVDPEVEPTDTLSPVRPDAKPRKIPASTLTMAKKSSAKTEESKSEAEVDVWTTEQQEALTDAKLKIPTTASNFWAQVAQHVPGKSATDCQAKTFEQFRSPPTDRKAAKKAIKRASAEPRTAVPSKIARAGSNKFKKQVREFVEEYEKKHVDDLFETTPSKEGLPELPEFDSIKSPELGTPSRSFDEDDSEMDESLGRLKKLSSRKRDDIDSYVLGINRLHVAGGGEMKRGRVRRLTSAVPVASETKAMSTKKKAVEFVEEVGSRSLKGVLSPGGTTHVRLEKGDSSSEDEDEVDCRSSEEEEDFDVP
uniref:Myb-like domain-containing protein n=1 Tax=Hyaloperonospora arabidopsidis (strain Emoy2) TaxID=559515 RepID=M4BGJ6_HYAAE